MILAKFSPSTFRAALAARQGGRNVHKQRVERWHRRGWFISHCIIEEPFRCNEPFSASHIPRRNTIWSTLFSYLYQAVAVSYHMCTFHRNDSLNKEPHLLNHHFQMFSRALKRKASSRTTPCGYHPQPGQKQNGARSESRQQRQSGGDRRGTQIPYLGESA